MQKPKTIEEVNNHNITWFNVKSPGKEEVKYQKI